MIDFSSIDMEVNSGYISVNYHPECKFRIFNYTNKAQFDWHWTPETMICRGLIVDSDNHVVARPFPKFFSYEQLDFKIPDEPFEVFDKLDGSLGILYWIGDEPSIATRGSFVSEQAIRATEMFRDRYKNLPFDRKNTYLFEIIYPENRIVVDYGDVSDLFLLAVIETETGKELPLPSIGVPIVKRYDGIKDFSEIISNQESNREGYVVRFESGQRVKLKFEEYKRLHKILTGINARRIWEHLRDDTDWSDLIDRVPDEYFEWFRSTEKELRDQYNEIERQAMSDFKILSSRKETAEYFNSCANPSVLFSMLDGKDYSSYIWKMIRPKSARAFRCDVDA